MEAEKRLEKLLDITGGSICPNCFGRKFSDIISGPGNPKRAEKLTETFKLKKSDKKCKICKGILEDLEKTADYVEKKIKKLNLEFSTLLVGSRLPEDILSTDEEINNQLNIEVESIKKEINRELGKILKKRFNCSVDFENPDIVVKVDFRTLKPRAWIQINPLFIEGRYRKLVRGIPQTKWPCRECKGRGCPRCNFTGKMYPTSVEELVAEPVLKATQGSGSKFHGAGREDVDVRMLGKGRPFILEIKEPRIRTLNLKEIANEINKSAGGKIEVLDLKFSTRNRKVEIKSSSSYKIYRAKVKLKDEIEPSTLERLKSLNLIKQRTPRRVSHRRADKIRKRRVIDVKWEIIDPRTLELILKTEGGLYIKELISGDDGRTKPSVSEILKTPAECIELDVLEVE
ncbi:MAG TPA: tRNA pseudouridine(54/55) synthase Pus10 [Methanothermobacter sp.]|jgi:tRNA pseudouridine synthase 10|uniref:tRNA pseudouridine synthase Pus10 n=1 Tax=Methanothermobacter tenebrarum TaxID=680118 RepID=A0ABN6P964_9EURY|nr:tRNA pseudouridine(54/55) synthase Pus10 [Methanothermobacter tenebrarum]MDD3454179.1 tRNA pseudouridine(54/55) synthase Pus10 [Methanobacteriales archaeon]MDX9693973.1 tRNA pseudouridine(54/55) synthase Pus10 [Methanothermobacter sp.]BDH78742.1 tRNA pseudouridine(54/55) synthase Pus10 [Methanothermobacter tenebrarum]HHW16540.1 tRNA pseudouridine(54/55) synthase Pus10 [Methanothermobacter sp.]HOQ20445.1 tRNA pseudouridine(54/55) synthase Pus10 [Methanothermobacter sp.]